MEIQLEISWSPPTEDRVKISKMVRNWLRKYKGSDQWLRTTLPYDRKCALSHG